MRPTRHRLFSWLALILLAGTAAGVLHLVAAIQPENYRTRILETLEQVTGHKARMGQLELAPALGIQLRIRDLELLSHDPTEPPFLQVQEALITPSLAMLWKRDRLAISAITLVRPQITLVQRHEQKLLERAQTTARLGDARLAQLMHGQGLSQIQIGRITLTNGIIAILDWEAKTNATSTLILDHLQAHIHNVTANRASPISASARFQDIPFTANGQLGPLPENVDLTRMPLILSLEAKAVDPSLLLGTIAFLPIQAHTSRGYFSALLHGNLAEGMQVNSLLQMERLTLSLPAAVRTPPTFDLMVRQNSVMQLLGDDLNWHLKELYLSTGGTPLLEARGHWHSSQGLFLELSSRQPLPVAQLPLPVRWPLQGGTLKGTLLLEGNWTERMNLHLTLQLKDTVVAATPIHKGAGPPLALDARLEWDRLKGLGITNAVLQATPGEELRLSGRLTPQPDLTVVGEWQLANLKHYLAPAREWNANGRIALEEGKFRFTEQAEGGSGWHGSGRVQLHQSQLGWLKLAGVRAALLLAPEGTTITLDEMRLAGGVVQGAAFLATEPVERPPFHASLVAAGIRLEELSSPLPPSLFPVEGILSGHGNLQGTLDGHWLPTEPLAMQGHLEIGPGRMLNLNPLLLSSPQSGEISLATTGKAFYWETLSADLAISQGQTWLSNLEANSAQLRLTGRGRRDPMGGHYELLVSNDWVEGTAATQWRVGIQERAGTLTLGPAMPVGNP